MNNITASSQAEVNLDEELPGYKLFNLSRHNFLAGLDQGISMRQMITDEYVWIIPNDVNGETKVQKKSGKWEVIGYSVPDSSAKSGVIHMEQISEASLKAVGDLQTEESICFSAPMFYTNFIYLTNGEEEYLIPFSSRPDFNGLENGEIYPLEIACDILRKEFPQYVQQSVVVDQENGGNGGGMTNGGEGSSDGFVSRDALWYVVGVFVLVDFVLGTILLYLKKRNRS